MALKASRFSGRSSTSRMPIGSDAEATPEPASKLRARRRSGALGRRAAAHALPKELAQSRQVDGLLDDGARRGAELLAYARARDPAREEDEAIGELGPHRTHAVAQLDAVHRRHHHVAKDDVERLAGGEAFERLLGARRRGGLELV